MKYFLLPVFCLYSLVTTAQSSHRSLRNGDQAYTRNQYKVAEKHYREAADLNYGDPQAVYNLGNALYKQGNWEDAALRFSQAATQAKTPELRADALHNLGNALMKQHRFEQAVGAYEESLRHRPADPETKMNLQMARKKWQEEQQKEREKQQQNQQQNQQEQKPGDSQKQDPSQPNQPPGEEKSPNNPPQETPPQPSQTPPREQTEKQEIKKGDAKKLLETAVGAEDRKNAKKYRAAQQKSKPGGTRKDW
jgi:tetratricopeptide (TPR) repeat protein